MKKFAEFKKEVGDSVEVTGAIGVAEKNIRVEIAVEYPVEKVAQPVLKVVDDLVDKLERLIPGDQTAQAEKAKLEARAAILLAFQNAANG